MKQMLTKTCKRLVESLNGMVAKSNKMLAKSVLKGANTLGKSTEMVTKNSK